MGSDQHDARGLDAHHRVREALGGVGSCPRRAPCKMMFFLAMQQAHDRVNAVVHVEISFREILDEILGEYHRRFLDVNRIINFSPRNEVQCLTSSGRRWVGESVFNANAHRCSSFHVSPVNLANGNCVHLRHRHITCDDAAADDLQVCLTKMTSPASFPLVNCQAARMSLVCLP